MPSVPKPNFPRRIPKRKERNNFDRETRDKILERDNNTCQNCMNAPGTQIHHTYFRSRGGRGVFTNGLTVCQPCHTLIHLDNELADYWIEVYTDRYGARFYKDEYDI